MALIRKLSISPKADNVSGTPGTQGSSVAKTETEETFTINTEFLTSSANKILAKRLVDLPVGKDLPRLLRGFEITLVGPPETLVYKEDPSLPRTECMKDILVVLAMYIDGERAAAEVASLVDTLDPTGDLNIAFTRFVQSGFLDEKKYKFVGALKAVQQDFKYLVGRLNTIAPVQEMVYPVVMELRRGIYYDSKMQEKFPYRDIKGTWSIKILIEQSVVTVIHHKWEACRYDKFKFHWFFEVRLPFNGPITATLKIINYAIADTVSPDEHKQIVKTFQPFLATTAEYNALWSRPNSLFSLKHDVTSLADRLTITDQYGNVLFKKNQSESAPSNARRFLMLLASYIEPSSGPLVEQLFNEHVKQTGDLSEQLSKVFTPEFAYKAPKLTRMLKLLSHDMISHCTHQLREKVYPEVPFQDVKRSYRVHVQMTIIDKNDFLGSRISIAPGSLPLLPSTRMKASSPATPAGVVPAHSPGTSSVSFVVVTHRKLQKSVSTNPKDTFKFEWILTLKSRRSMEELYSADFRILDVRFDKNTSPQVQERVSRVLLPLLVPKQVADTVFNVSVDALLEALVNHVGEDTVYCETFPHSVPTRIALLALQRTIRENKQGDLRVLWK